MTVTLTTFTIDDVYDALEALPGAHPDPKRVGNADVALTVTGADLSMVETWVPARVYWPRRGNPAAVAVSAYVTYAEAEAGGWMAAYDYIEFTDHATAAEVAETVQKRADELVTEVNEAARLVLDGRLADAARFAEEHRIKWEPADMSLEAIYEELDVA
ncbi:hypothetical protein [Mycobacterium sp. 155]|uniref:hypothetical protein n=1 Tax=Mycobacterium sp. 155 TaxID=1157943 RepID=UPI00036ECD17|nr:hypothetical protein [Mycobacterium sp. 155]